MPVDNPGKFGSRKTVEKLSKADVTIANELNLELNILFDKFGEDLEIEIPENLPLPLDWPLPAISGYTKGEHLMNYTMAVSGHSLGVLRAALYKYGYMYEIVPLQGYYSATVQYRDTERASTIWSEYIKALLWVVRILRKSLENKYSR